VVNTLIVGAVLFIAIPESFEFTEVANKAPPRYTLTVTSKASHPLGGGVEVVFLILRGNVAGPGPGEPPQLSHQYT
jgi:hypothetical protein